MNENQILALQAYLPNHLFHEIQMVQREKKIHISEIRIRISRPIEINNGKTAWFLTNCCTTTDMEHILQQMTHHSFHSFTHVWKEGFMTLPGGHRVGLCGETIIEANEVKTFRWISSIVIRVAYHIQEPQRNITNKWIELQAPSTLVVGPPQSGKTSLLRSIAIDVTQRLPKKVVIIDERNELAGCYQGVPTFPFGHRVDVLSDCPKKIGFSMAIRTLSPEVIIVDEIGSVEELKQIEESHYAGISVIASIHANDFASLQKRPLCQGINLFSLFPLIVTLTKQYNISLWNKDGRIHV